MIDDILESINAGFSVLISKIESSREVDSTQLEDYLLAILGDVDRLTDHTEKLRLTASGGSLSTDHNIKVEDSNTLLNQTLLDGNVLPLLTDAIRATKRLRGLVLSNKGASHEHSQRHENEENFTLGNSLDWPAPEIHTGVPVIAIDVGGTLVKIGYFVHSDMASNSHILHWLYHYFYDAISCLEKCYSIDVLTKSKLPSTLRKCIPNSIHLNKDHALGFLIFPTEQLEGAIDLLIERNIIGKDTVINTTGGGAYKYNQLIKNKLTGHKVEIIQETSCVFAGTKFVHRLQNSFVQYHGNYLLTDIASAEPSYPYLIVNIGSGVCMLKASSEDKFEWVTGTSLGGGCAHGLSNALLGLQNFDELMTLYDRGTNCMDSFKNVTSEGEMAPLELSYSFNSFDGSPSREDTARSIVDMVSYNIGTLAFLTAKLHNTKRIILTGTFTRNYRVTLDSVANAVRQMEKTQEGEPMELLVPTLGSYVGVLGELVAS